MYTTLNAYMTQYGDLAGKDLYSASSEDLARGLFVSKHDYKGENGFTLVGTAEVKITLMARDELVNAQVEALRQRQTAVLAEAQKQATDIERQIQSLLAITNEVA